MKGKGKSHSHEKSEKKGKPQPEQGKAEKPNGGGRLGKLERELFSLWQGEGS
jgi:hypothetical protein